MAYTIPFSGLGKNDIPIAGGKGANLGELASSGFTVPPGFVVTTEAYKTFIHANSLEQAIIELLPPNPVEEPQSYEIASKRIEELFLRAKVPEDVHNAITTAVAALGASSVAVRSSATTEDLPDASFAGQQSTYLNVRGENELIEAVKRCWASLWTARAISYRQRRGIDPSTVSLAVVVQQQLAPESAGVAFSINPLNNDYDEAVINANWGLGESVVSGMVSPDQYVVDKVTKKIIERQPGSKEKVAYLNDEGGIEYRSNSRPSEFCLTDEQVQAITEVLIRVENLYQTPIDIEWAISGETLYLLQARPITAYVPLVPEMMTKPGERRILYFDIGLVDIMTINQPMTPLTIDWMFGSLGMWITPYIGKVNLQPYGQPKESLLFAAGGRAYVNLSQVLAVIDITRYSSGASQMDDITAQLLANVDVNRYKAEKKIPSLRWLSLLRKLPQIISAMVPFSLRTLYSMWFPEAVHRKFKREIDKTIKRLKEFKADGMTLREMIVKLNDDLTPVIGKVCVPPMTLYMQYMMKYMAKVDKLMARGTTEEKRLAESLTSGFERNEAAKMGIQLYRMAKMLPESDWKDLDELAERIRQRQLPEEFLAAWDAFVEQFGFRGPSELELSNPRYGDDPRLALEQISYMVKSDHDPETAQRQRVEARQRAYEQLLQKLNWLQRLQLQRIYKIINLFGPFRDTPKYLWVIDNGLVRRSALEEGQKFVQSGRLDQPEDIFWLTLDEIDRANADPTFDLRQARDAKKSFYKKLNQVITFPHMIDSRGRIIQAKSQKAGADTFVGQGISRGNARGRVKILLHPREKSIEKGDVLVTYTTDPGWTPLFVNAEAIVLEIGGMLQHGGVVAREYGKPCVVGIQGITKALKDGQLVEVDGTSGIVRLIEDGNISS